MAIYITIATILFIGVFARQNQSKIIYYTGLLCLFIITAFRDPSLGGWDAIIYQRFYQAVPMLSELTNHSQPYAIGYTFLNSLIKSMGCNYIGFQIIYSLISLILLELVIRALELSDNQKCLFLFSYFCYRFIWNTWVTYRQNIANLIFWLFLTLLYKEIQNWQEKKEIKGETKTTTYSSKIRITYLMVLTVLCPSLFHSSGLVNIIVLPIILLLPKISNRKKTIWVPIISLALYFFGTPLYSYLITLLNRFVDSRYSMYGIAVTASSNTINYFFRLAFFLILSIRSESASHRFNQLFFDLMTVMVIVGSINAELVTRMYEFYALGLYASMSLFLDNFTINSRKMAGVLFYIAMLIILVRFVLITDNGLYNHYFFASF